MEKETELQAEIIEIMKWIVAQFSIWIYEYEKKKLLTAEVPPLFVTLLEHSRHRIFPLYFYLHWALVFFKFWKVKG